MGDYYGKNVSNAYEKTIVTLEIYFGRVIWNFNFNLSITRNIRVRFVKINASDKLSFNSSRDNYQRDINVKYIGVGSFSRIIKCL